MAPAVGVVGVPARLAATAEPRDEDAVATRAASSTSPPGSDEQEDQQAGAARQELRLEAVVEERRHAEDVERAEDRAGDGAEPADHGDGDDEERQVGPEGVAAELHRAARRAARRQGRPARRRGRRR